MRPLMQLVDVVIANEEDIQSVLGLHVEGTDVTTGQLDLEAYHRVARTITDELGPLVGGHHAARERVGERQRLGRGHVREGDRHLPSQSALRRAAGRSHWWRGQLRGRAHLRPGHRAAPWRRRSDSRSRRARSNRRFPATSIACRSPKSIAWPAAMPAAACSANESVSADWVQSSRVSTTGPPRWRRASARPARARAGLKACATSPTLVSPGSR